MDARVIPDQVGDGRPRLTEGLNALTSVNIRRELRALIRHEHRNQFVSLALAETRCVEPGGSKNDCPTWNVSTGPPPNCERISPLVI